MKNFPGKIALLLLAIPLFRFTTQPTTDESIIYYRIESILSLKKEIMEKAWPQTKDTAYDIPLIYYTDSVCYVANPGEKFMSMARPELKYQNGNLRIYKTQSRMDSIPWHMETNVSDVETSFDYLLPYSKVIGLEESRKFAMIPLEAWNGMILHELFHGYQFKHQQFYHYAIKSKLIYAAINDSLQGYYNIHDWYKKGIDQENALLLQAIEEKDLAKKKTLTRQMLETRSARRKTVDEKLNRPVAFYEPGFETMEGTARYIEMATIVNMIKPMIAGKLIALDSNYKKLLPAVELKPLADIAIKTEATQRYTYAIGYNMCRLLDTYNKDYKSRLFKTPDLTLEKILQEVVQ